MSVDQPRVIDIISRNPDGQIVFLESGEIYEQYPDAKGRPIQIKVVFMHQPNLEANAFLAEVKPIVESAGFAFGAELFSASPYRM